MTSCYFCGKEIKDYDKKKGRMHYRCEVLRKRIDYQLRPVRWRNMMKNPEIRKKIRESDKNSLRPLFPLG